MRIKSLRVAHFGKLKNRAIPLEDGLNIIYGENETGKTTLQTFIKAMFYGLGSSKKDIRENERKRFLPWSGDDAGGELLFQDDFGKEYLIKRSFGEKKKKDDTLILDPISGDEIGFIDGNQPGLSFFSMGEEAFEKTVFIKQLHSQVERDKEDEIMKRLTNLHQTGDEDTSYHKAMGALQLARKGLIGQRKMGRLDEIQAAYGKLKEAWKVAKGLHEENINDQMHLNSILEEKTRLHDEMADLEKKKKERRHMEQKHEYHELCGYSDRIKALILELEEKQKMFQFGDQRIDESYILDLRHLFRQWKELKGQALESMELSRIIKAEYEEKRAYLQNYDDVEDDMEMKLSTMIQESQQMEERLRAWDASVGEIQELEVKLQEERNNLGILRKFEDVTPGLELDIYDKEEKLKELKAKLSGDQRREHLQLKQDMLRSQMKNSVLMLVIGILALGTGVAGGIGLHPSFYIAGGIGLLLSIYGWISRQKASHERMIVEKEISVIGDSLSIQKEIEEIRKELGEIYYRLGILGFQEFRTHMMKYTEKKNRMEELRIRIEDRKRNINSEKPQALKARLKDLRGEIQRIFAQWNCDSLEDFSHRCRLYRKTLTEKERVLRELKDLGEKIQQIEIQREEIEREMRAQLNLKEIDEIGIENGIVTLSEGLKGINDLEREKNSLEDTFRTLLKGRTIEGLQEAMEDFAGLDESENPESEDVLEGKLKGHHQQLIELEKQIKDLQYRMQHRFAHSGSLAEIEEEMAILETQILELEEIAATIDCSLEVLESTFHEIQRSFGPRLNKAVGEILGQITQGKYDELKISEGYHVKVVDPLEDRIKEIDYFSNGTWDQIYFAMRMGITKLIFDGSDVPVIMDDAFVQYDENRLEAVLSYLYEYAQSHQVILFTCQKRELALLESFENVNYIYL